MSSNRVGRAGRLTGAVREAVRRGRATPRTTAVYAVTAATFVAFAISTIPGVRSHAGYNEFFDGVLNNLGYELSALLCLVRAAGTNAHRRSWHLLAAGLALYGLGDIYWTLFLRTHGSAAAVPAIANALWLSFYGCAFVALLLVMRQIADRLPLSVWLDGIVGGLAVAAIAAAVVGPVISVGHRSDTATAVLTAAYPLLDVLLLLVVTALLAMFHWRPPAGLWFFAGGLSLFAVADVAYLFLLRDGAYTPGRTLDTAWLLATAVMAMAPGRSKRPTGTPLPPALLLGIPVGATLFAVGLLVYGHDHTLHSIAVGLAAATVVAAIGRLVATFFEVNTLAHSHRLALTDELTGLANRRAFYEHAERYLTGTTQPCGGLLLLDLDRFKEVNDSLGHHAGDDLLRQVAQRLHSGLHREQDLLARLGGDEFALFLADVDESGAATFADRVRTALLAPFMVDGVTVRVAASIGVAVFPTHGDEVSTLLRRADIAMYHAKDLQIGYRIYDQADDNLGGHDRLRTLEELRQTIYARQLVIHYQPKVDSQSSQVFGVEALVRWDHPERGLLAPDVFLPLAEDAGLMRDLTMSVLEQSLDQICRWRSEGRYLSVAVNLSASSLVDLELPEQVRAVLAQRGLPASALELEITEDFLMGDRERAREILTQLRELGIRVAVDDFGTGYSSLAYLRELPIDELKLDRSFVQPMADDPRAAAIVRSTISLAHSLGMRLVAEGVENEITAGHLALSGCDVSQGFYFSRALPAAELEVWLDGRLDGRKGLVGLEFTSTARTPRVAG
jgi:diguanylate cyclase